jgi:glycosyltransferase involved in cell wall biosynthesis
LSEPVYVELRVYRLRVGFYPGVGNNAYQGRMQAIVAQEHEVVPVPRIKWLALGRLRAIKPPLDVILVSWLENTLVSRKTGRLQWAGLLGFRAKLWVLRRLSRRLVMVRHNEFPHRTAVSDQARVKALLDQLESRFDAVITHSGHNAGSRLYVPHPLYEPVESQASNQVFKTGELYCLAFGRISPYKNLLALVEHWDGPCKLVIAGPCNEPVYLKALRQAAEGRSVDIKAGFVPEQEAVSLMLGARCALLAHSGEEMVVSGSYFYAISQGTPVMAVKSGFLNWLASQDGPGLTLFGSAVALARAGSSLEADENTETSHQIRRKASWLFGDDVVRDHLLPVLSGKRR